MPGLFLKGGGVWLLPIQLLLLRLCLSLLLLPPPPQGAPWNCEMHPICSFGLSGTLPPSHFASERMPLKVILIFKAIYLSA